MCTLKELCTVRTPSGSYPPQATEIISRLHLGDYFTASNLQTLNNLSITHIVSVMPGPVDLPPWEKAKHLQLAVDDMPFADILSHLHPAVNFIAHALEESPDSRVLVHCFQGVSRSTTVVCAYLMVSKGWSVSQALAHVKAVRTVAEPNFGFVSQLEEFQQTIKS